MRIRTLNSVFDAGNMSQLSANEDPKQIAELQIRTLGHHGIIAGYADKLKVFKRIYASLAISTWCYCHP